MSDADVLPLILDRLDRMESEARQQRAEIVQSIDRLAERVGVQNGRIGKIELWKHGLETVKSLVSTRRARWGAFIIAATSGIVVSVAGGLIAYFIRPG